MPTPRQTHRTLQLLLLIALGCLAVLVACSSSDGPTDPADPGDPGDPPDDDPLFTETNAAVDAVAANLDDYLRDQSLVDALTAGAADLLAYECVASAECRTREGADPYLLAQFTNGMLLIMPVVRLDTTAMAEKDAVAPPSLPEVEEHLPASRQAVFFDLPVFHTNDPTLVQVARLYGYRTDIHRSFDVDDFRNLGIYGLVHFGIHGGTFDWGGIDYFQMTTTEWRSTGRDLQLIATGDFRDVSVLLERRIYIEWHENPFVIDKTHYAVTNGFIEKYSGAFPDHSLVFVDNCESANVGEWENDPPLLRTLEGMNVGTYVGWTEAVNNVHAVKVENYLLTHMLGAIPSGLHGVEPKTPPIRPFTFQDTYISLQIRGWHIDPVGNHGAELLYKNLTDDNYELTLRPSIRQLLVQVDEETADQTLKLLGDFGASRGTVHCCESPQVQPESCDELTIKTWEKDEIVVEFQEPHHGYVMVMVDKHPSNAHPLSEWSGDLTVTGSYSIGPEVQLTAHAVWRAEIVDERPMPDLPPLPEFGWTSTLFGLDAECEFEFSGRFEDSHYIYEYPEDANTGTVPMTIEGDRRFFGAVTLKPVEGILRCQGLFSAEAFVLKTDKFDPEAEPIPDWIPVNIPLVFEATMSATGDIEAGEAPGAYTLSWPDMTPESPPLETTGH